MYILESVPKKKNSVNHTTSVFDNASCKYPWGGERGGLLHPSIVHFDNPAMPVSKPWSSVSFQTGGVRQTSSCFVAGSLPCAGNTWIFFFFFWPPSSLADIRKHSGTREVILSWYGEPRASYFARFLLSVIYPPIQGTRSAGRGASHYLGLPFNSLAE